MCGNVMDKWFGFDPPDVIAPAQPPDPGVAAQERAEEETQRRGRRRSRLSTILTGGLGDPDFGTSLGLPALSGVTRLG